MRITRRVRDGEMLTEIARPRSELSAMVKMIWLAESLRLFISARTDVPLEPRELVCPDRDDKRLFGLRSH